MGQRAHRQPMIYDMPLNWLYVSLSTKFPFNYQMVKQVVGLLFWRCHVRAGVCSRLCSFFLSFRLLYSNLKERSMENDENTHIHTKHPGVFSLNEKQNIE